MVDVFLSLGSNLGDRTKNIATAIKCLEQTSHIDILVVSSIIETESEAAIGPSYLNGVVRISTGLSPFELLDTLHSIEVKLGRVKWYRNSPRIIDLDILLYGNMLLDDPVLKIPHPRMMERLFVMKPLLEIDPGIKDKLKVLKV